MQLRTAYGWADGQAKAIKCGKGKVVCEGFCTTVAVPSPPLKNDVLCVDCVLCVCERARAYYLISDVVGTRRV